LLSSLSANAVHTDIIRGTGNTFAWVDYVENVRESGHRVIAEVDIESLRRNERRAANSRLFPCQIAAVKGSTSSNFVNDRPRTFKTTDNILGMINTGLSGP
jgi:hypothetical protein